MYESPAEGQRSAEQERQKYKGIIAQAERVVILGFGFDEHNLRVLGFPYLKGDKKDQLEVSSKFRIIGSAYSNAEPFEQILMGLFRKFPTAKKVEFVVGSIKSFNEREGILLTESQAVKLVPIPAADAEEFLEFATMGGLRDCCYQNFAERIPKAGHWQLRCTCGSISIAEAKRVMGNLEILGVVYTEDNG